MSGFKATDRKNNKGGKLLIAYTLYEDSNGGSIGDITCNDNINNYDYIEIFFGKSLSMQSSLKISKPYVNDYALTCYKAPGTSFHQLLNKLISINNNKIVVNSAGGINIYASSYAIIGANAINIYKVVGYK